VLRGLAGVIKIAELPQALAVPAATPVNSVKELLALAKTSQLSYSSAGHGTVGNISVEMLKLATRADITHVPYKGGAPAMTALISGDVSMGRVCRKQSFVVLLDRHAAGHGARAVIPDAPTPSAGSLAP